MTYAEFKEKFLPELIKIKSFRGKIDYANQNLQRIGSGSGRIVYDIDGEKVLKLSKNPKGIAQNEAETNAGYYRDTHDIVAIVFDSAEDNSWLIAEKAKKVNEARIKQLTGIPSLNELFYYVKNFYSTNHGRGTLFEQDPEMIEQLNENEFVQDLTYFIANYSQDPGDYGRPSTYGEVLRDGQPTIVLTDYGLNDEVYNTYYSPERKNKPQYSMYELYDNYNGNDDMLGDMPPQDAIDTRRGMWAQLPYSVDDGSGVINEGFISFILDRDKYPTKALPSAPYIVDEFHNCVNNIDETLNHVKNKKKFYENLLKLQEYLIEQKFYNREPLGEILYLKEDGSAKFSTDNAMGQDDFPPHDNTDNSSSIQNDLNANINIEEDLEYHHVIGDATQDQYAMDEERKKSYMAGSSTVEVKQKCRLAGNGNTSTACNQGDINNLNIKPINEKVNEEVNPKEIRSDVAAIRSILNGKRGIAFVEINKAIAQKLEKKKIGVIPVRMTSHQTMMAIIFTDKVNAYLLYNIAKTNGGYLKDKTPEEAREIGNLLGYKPKDIELHIRNKYGSKVPIMPDKSPDDFDDLAEEVEYNFWDLNEENFPEFEKDIKQDLITHQLDKKFIRNYQDGEHTYSVFAVNGDQVRDNGFIEWVDGGNHWVDADLPKDEQKYAKHIPENDYWIDDVFMIKPADFEAILLHERTESFIIRHYGYEYDDAHEIANKVEMIFRKKIPDGANRALAEKIYDIFVANFKPEKSKQKHKPANESIEMLNEAQIILNNINEAKLMMKII